MQHASAAESDKPRIIEGTELMAMEFPPMRWAVHGIIPEGGSLLAGRPKTGKSWFILNLALSIASGGVALGKVPVDRGEVLYLALEDGPRRLQERLGKLLESQCLEMPRGIFFVNDWPRASKGGVQDIEKWIETHAWARLVIIDTMARFRNANSIRGDHYSEDYAAMGEVQKVAINRGVAILGVTHTRKPKAGAGAVEDPLDEVQHSSGLTGAADAVLVLERPRMSRTATLFITGRDVEERTLTLAVEDSCSRWTITTPDANDPDYGLDPDRRAVRAAIRKEEHALSPADIARILKKEPDAVRKLMSRMNKDGYLKKEGYGRYAIPEE